ncbi:transposase [Ensifer sp. LCM 4579]|uniref:transposase n=1 Tax=Ensifer sp. LCM 4579 TaxID=1848292 RepID=UPI0009F16EF0
MSAPSSGTRTFHMIEAVAERLEGAPRQLRRRWSDEFKAQVVGEAPEPGAGVSAIAHRVGIHPSQLFARRRDARDARRASARHSSSETTVRCAAGAVVEVVIGDVVVRSGQTSTRRTCSAPSAPERSALP